MATTAQGRTLSQGEIIDLFLGYGREHGITLVGQIKPNAGLQRCHIDGHKASSLNGAYYLYTDRVPNGYIEDHVSKTKLKWKLTGCATKALTAAERAEMDARRKQRSAQQEALNQRKRAKAKKKYAYSKPVTEHPYLARKNVKTHPDLRVIPVWWTRYEEKPGVWTPIKIKNALIVPLHDVNGDLCAVQAIFPELCPALGRDKDFSGQTQGAFFKIGKPTTTIVICEGLATGLTLHQSTKDQVYCAMSAGNMVEAAKIVRGLMPHARIVIAADNDLHTPGNPGVTAAKKAALAIGGLVAIPSIAGDFNDLANHGLV